MSLALETYKKKINVSMFIDIPGFGNVLKINLNVSMFIDIPGFGNLLKKIKCASKEIDKSIERSGTRTHEGIHVSI